MASHQQILAALKSGSAPVGWLNNALAMNPAGLWRLGELGGSTTAVDATGNGLSGTYTGSVTLEQTSLIASDLTNKACQFNSTGFVDLGTPSALNITGQITIWGALSVGTFPSGSQQNMLVCKGYDGTNQPFYWRLFNNSGTQEMHFGSFAGAGVDAVVKVNINGWSTGQTHFCIGGWDGTNWFCDIDGSSAGTAAFAQGAVSGTAPTYIGAEKFSGSNTHFYTGILDEVGIVATAFSPSQRLQLYNASL